MRADYHKHNYVVTPFVTAMPDVVSFPEQINTSPSNWYTTIDLASALFSIPVNWDHQKEFDITWQWEEYIFALLPGKYMNWSVKGDIKVYVDIYLRLGDLSNINVFSQSSEVWESNFHQVWWLERTISLACKWLPPPALTRPFSVFVQPRHLSHHLLSTPVLLGKNLTLIALFNLNDFLKSRVSKYNHVVG